MQLRRYSPLIGRLLLSFVFLLSGLAKIVDWSTTEQTMASKGMPAIPFFLLVAILVEIAGGLSLLFAWRPRFGAWLLFLYLIPTTLIFHNFWDLTGPERLNQMFHFLKNLSIMGGLIIIGSIPEADIKVRTSHEFGVFDEHKKVA